MGVITLISDWGSNDWWQRERLGVLIRPVTRDDEELKQTLEGLGLR